MATKGEFVEQVSIKYWLDGDSQSRALNKAQADWKASHKNARNWSKAEAKKAAMQLRAFSKVQLNILARDENTHQLKLRQNHRKSVQKRWNDRLALNRKNLAKERAIEKQSEAQARADSKGSLVNKFGGRLSTIGSYGAAIAVLNAVRQAVTFLITKAIALEVAFTDLAVKSGYTNAEMAKVSDTVLKVAQSTKFSTLEIVGAATALGKLGFSALEVQEILPSLAAVAGATGESLQSTAEILGKVINAYEYSANQVGIISDRMVDIFNNSALNLEKFNTAFSYVGSAAASTGTNFNELTSAMAILSDRGITASKIGTGLRNVFTKLGEEGDSLRDILYRISEANLSFYETAELVGRRAANQLFILADSLTEFDDITARSMDDYGVALKAAAEQMDTFKAKLDIMINTIANWVAPEFDKDDTWKNSIEESITLMDFFNATLSDATVKTTFARLTNQYEEFGDEFLAMKKKIGNKSDWKVISAMIQEQTDLINSGDFSGRKLEELKQYRHGLEDIRMLMSWTGETRLSETLGEKALAFDKNVEQKAFIKWQGAVKRIVAKVTKLDPAGERNNFLNSYFQNVDFTKLEPSVAQSMEEGYKSTIEKMFKDKEITEEDANILLEGLDYAWEIREKESKKYRKFSLDSYEKDLETRFNKNRELIKRKAGRLITDENLKELEKFKAEDADQIRKLITADTNLKKIICEEGGTLAIRLNLNCDKTKTKKPAGTIDSIDAFSELREKYKTDKAQLERDYSQEKDPVKQLDINRKLIQLETTFRSELTKKYENYLNGLAVIRNNWLAKNTTEADKRRFDSNVAKTEDALTKDIGAGDREVDRLQDRDTKGIAKAYTYDVEAKSKYQLNMAKLNLKFKKTDRKDKKERKKLLDEMNKISADYYLKAELKLGAHYEELKKRREEIIEANLLPIAEGESPISLEPLDKQIGLFGAQLNKVRTDATNAQKAGKKEDTEETLFDWDALFEMTENVYNIYSELGDRKLELLKEQTERELALIQERFEREGNIRDSALRSGIISQEQSTEAEARANKKRIDNENKVNKKLFKAQKKRDKEDAIYLGATSTAKAIANAFATHDTVTATIFAAISAAAIATSTAMNVAAISKRKFVPQTYADGGLIVGDSHTNGGVPFSVNGRNGFEAEGGEFIVNKEATSRNLEELKRINSKTQRSNKMFATGGYVSPDEGGNEFNALLLEAISKPVRAYVTDQDLTKSNSEREALTKKTTY